MKTLVQGIGTAGRWEKSRNVVRLPVSTRLFAPLP
jgi:hypothetical protein